MSLIKLPRWLSDNQKAAEASGQTVSELMSGPLHPSIRRPDIKLETAEDMEFVLAFTSVVQDDPDTARATVRDLSAKDRAVLQFHLAELSRIVQEEDQFRTTADRRAARLSYEGSAYPDGYDV